MSTSHAIAPCRRVEGSIRVPGDKSISHRALIVAAMMEGQTPIAGLSPAQDVRSTARILRQLGVRVRYGEDMQEDVETQAHLHVDASTVSSLALDFQCLVESGSAAAFQPPGEDLDVGNSGTTIRLMTGVLAGSSATATLSGDPSIRRRPMARVVEPLRQMGARIEGIDGGMFAPLTVQGAPLHGRDHLLTVASAQVKSALLLAGLSAAGETSVTEPTASRDHTERLLAYLGAPITVSGNRVSVKSIKLQSAELLVPGDLSSAAFLLVAAAILPGSHLVVQDVGLNPSRTGILDILQAFGAGLELSDLRTVCGEPVGTVTVRAADRRPIEVAGELAVRAIDELPLVGVLGAVAEGETVLRDAGELRIKESDRIEAIVDALGAMGADITATPDGFVVRGPTSLSTASVDPKGDHRIAMTAAIAALVAQDGPTTIEDWGCVGVSYPGFDLDLARIVVP